MTAFKMCDVLIQGKNDDCFEILLPCINNRNVVPKPTSAHSEKKLFSDKEQLYKNELSKISGILKYLKITPDYFYTHEYDFTAKNNIAKVKRIINSIKEIKKDDKFIKDEIKKLTDAASKLSHFELKNIDIDKLFNCKYFKCCFGKIPFDSAVKLQYYTDSNFVFIELDRDNSDVWGIVVYIKSAADETNHILERLYFTPIDIPESLVIKPKSSEKLLQSQIKWYRKTYKSNLASLDKIKDRYSYFLISYFNYMYCQYKISEYSSKYLVVSDKHFVFEFRIPQNEVKELKKQVTAAGAYICIHLKQSGIKAKLHNLLRRER